MKIPETWQDWCRIYNDPDYWQDEIKSILESVDIRPETIVCGYPGTNAVFEINGKYVLKIFVNVLPNSYRKELYIHSNILPQSTIYPSVLFNDTSENGFNFILFNKIGGTALREYYRNDLPVLSRTAEELGRIIGVLHDQTKDIRPQEGIENRNNPDRSIPDCLVNYDITEDHIFIDDSGRISAVIDFGDACLAHPSHEFPALFAAGLNCDPELITTFQRTYEDASSFTINHEKVAAALLVHDFSEDILEYVRRLDTGYSRKLLRIIKDKEKR